MSFRNSLLKVGCPTAKLTLPFPYQSRTKAPRWIPPNLTLTQTLTQVGIHRGGELTRGEFCGHLSKGLMKHLKAFIKPFEAPQRSVKIKI